MSQSCWHGGFAHRDGDDNRRFAKLAAVAVGRSITKGSEDYPTNLMIEAALEGTGPTIVHAYLYSPTQILLTIQHEHQRG